MVEKMLKSLESAINALSGMYKGFSEKKDYGRRGFLKASAAIGTGVLAACCDSGGGSGGGGDDPAPNPGDTTAPGKIDDLFATSSNNYGETVVLAWTSSGDDGHVGSPDHFIIAYSNNPIVTDADWDNATLAASLQASGPAGTQYAEEFEVGLGDLYFAIKAVDEAGNQSNISNSPTAYIPSKAEFYVDKWLPTDGFDLNYNESVLSIRGDVGMNIDYKADALAQILINTDDQNGNPYTAWATWEDIRDILLQVTDGVLVANNSELINASNATQQSTPGMGYAMNLDVVNPLSGVTEQKVFPFLNMTSQEWGGVYNIHKDALVKIVEEIPENYGGTSGGAPDPAHNPNWT